MIQIKKTLSLAMAAVFVMAGVLGNISAKAADITSPTINFVGLEHTPLVAGDKQAITVTAANYDGMVQYAAFMNVGTKWTKLSGYGAPVDSKTPYVLPKTIALKAGKYPVRVWIRKAGVVGANSNVFGDYESFNKLLLNCVAKNANSVYTGGAANYEVEGMKVTFNGIDNIGGMPGPYLYKLFVMNTATGAWANGANTYSATPSYTFETAGNYMVVLHVNTATSTNKYKGIKIINVTVKEDGPTAVSITSVKTIAPINAVYGTAKDALELPTEVTLNLSDGTTKLVDATWANSTYNGNESATYTFSGTYTCPTGVTGTMPEVTADVVVGVNSDLADITTASEAVSELQAAAAKDLTIEANLTAVEALVQPAKDAVVKVDTAAIKISLTDSITFTTETITAARTAFDTKTTTVTVLDTTVSPSSSGVGVMGNVTLTAEGKINFATATKYVIYDGVDPITDDAGTILGTATTVYPKKVSGDMVTVKLLDENGVIVKAIDVKLGESGTIEVEVPVVTTATLVEAAGFGFNVTVNSTQKDAVKYQIWNDVDPITTIATLGDSTLIIGKAVGDKVTVKLFDVDGAVIATKTEIVLVAGIQ